MDKFTGQSKDSTAVRTSDPSTRAHRQLENHNYAGRAYTDLNLIVNHRDIAITLNDGSLIYNS